MKSISSTAFILNLLIILLIFTSLRNLSPFYYLVIFVNISLLSYVAFSRPFPINFFPFIFYIFCAYSLFVIYWSGIYMQSLEFLVGVPRLLLMPVLTFLLMVFIEDRKQFISIFKILLFCYLIAAFSIIYQIFFGSISWFSPQFERGNLDRYASILGSLTVYGSVVGYPILIVLSRMKIIKNNLYIFLIILGTILATFFSLSKTGVVIFGLSLALITIFEGIPLLAKIKLKSFILFFISVIAFILIIGQIPIFIKYYNVIVSQTIGGSSFLSNSEGVLLDSPAVDLDHIIRRLTKWSSGMLNEYGNVTYFVGVGLQGGAGVMGMHPVSGVYGSAHNSFGDLFFMGGFPYLIIFLSIFLCVQITLLLNFKDMMAKLLFMLNILFFANLFVASGSIFQPSISIFFWLSIIYANFLNKKIDGNFGL